MNPAYPFDLARGKKSGLSFGRDTEMRVILKEEIVQKIREVGLEKGDAVMVHMSLETDGLCLRRRADCDRSADGGCRRRRNDYDAHPVVEEMKENRT